MNMQWLENEVAEVFRKLEINPSEASQGEGQWVVVRDFLPLYIDAWHETQKTPWNYATFEQDSTVFQLSLPFCYGPTLKKYELDEELLAVNLNMFYAKFTYNQTENVYALVYRIPGGSASSEHVLKAIESIYYYGHMVFEVLKDEFNLKRVSIEEEY